MCLDGDHDEHGHAKPPRAATQEQGRHESENGQEDKKTRYVEQQQYRGESSWTHGRGVEVDNTPVATMGPTSRRLAGKAAIDRGECRPRDPLRGDRFGQVRLSVHQSDPGRLAEND